MAEAAGPGVFGTITGLGSIDVNGLHIEFPMASAPSGLLDGAAAAAGGRAVRRRGDGRAGRRRACVARKVVEILPLVGPVEGVDPLQRRITVMGTPVRLDTARRCSTGPATWPYRSAAIAPATGWPSAALWREGAVVASRIERLPPRPRPGSPGCCASIDGAVRIGGTTIADADRAERPASLPSPGAYRDGRLVAERIVTGADDAVPGRRSTGSSSRRFSPATRTIRATICPASGSRWTRPRRCRRRSASARSSSAATTAAS